MLVSQDDCRGEQQTMVQNTRQTFPECGQHNVRATARDNTRQKTKDTLLVLRYKLKYVVSPGIVPWPPGWGAGTYTVTPVDIWDSRDINYRRIKKVTLPCATCIVLGILNPDARDMQDKQARIQRGPGGPPPPPCQIIR